MHSWSRLPLAVTVAVAGLLLSGCSGSPDDSGEPSDPSPSAAESSGGSDGTDGSDGSDEASPDDALVLSECGIVRARPGDARRTEYLTEPVVARVGRGEAYDLGSEAPAPTTRVGAAVTAPTVDAEGVEVARSLERRIARAAGVQVGFQVRAREEGPGNTFTNDGPARDFAFVDYVKYRVARWSADDCLAFPGETVEGTLTYDMRPGDGVLSCEPVERPPGGPFESVLRRICPA